MEIKTLPQMPEEVIKDTFEFAQATPHRFVSQTIAELGGISPHLVRFRLLDALQISAMSGPYDALWSVKQALFIPACFLRLAREGGSQSIAITSKTLEKMANLQASTEDALLERVAKYSQTLADSLVKLNDLAQLDDVHPETQVASFRKALRGFEFFEIQIQDDTKEEIETIEDAPPPSIPVIREGIVNDNLLEISLRPIRFMRRAQDSLKEKVGEGAAAMISFGFSSLGGESFMLSAFVSNSICREYQERGITVPAVTTDLINSLIQGDAERLSAADDSEKEALVKREINYLIKLVETENGNLHRGYQFLKRNLAMYASSADSILGEVYKIFRSKVEVDHLSRIFT